MECPRCTGSMIEETFDDMQDDTGQFYFRGLRCMICGEILDPVIVANRVHRPHMKGKNRKLLSIARS